MRAAPGSDLSPGAVSRHGRAAGQKGEAVNGSVRLGVTEYQMLSSDGAGVGAVMPVGPLRGAVAGNSRAACGAPIVDVLDHTWPPRMGACLDRLDELAPATTAESAHRASDHSQR